ncbi:type VI immunity family protein [Providencia sp. PROV132]|uniref:type VI immunity family protein n=1 Tax=Providencia sp. PROV132 TaxID=2949842 RepID=UPI00234A09C5|nr:type VI immunity family protein [Providencia sp. PROV132]
MYVKVNHVLKPIRNPSFKSFHLGSISGEIRLDERLTKEWQERFDAEGEKLSAPRSSNH